MASENAPEIMSRRERAGSGIPEEQDRDADKRENSENCRQGPMGPIQTDVHRALWTAAPTGNRKEQFTVVRSQRHPTRRQESTHYANSRQ